VDRAGCVRSNTKHIVIMALTVLVVGCGRNAADTRATVWVNPAVGIELGNEGTASLRAELQSCAATQADLPKSCKVGSKVLTFSKMPSANCHWQCGSICPEKDKCAWEVKAGDWSLEYQRPAAIGRERRHACDENWERIFNDPVQYEQASCEADCYQLSAVVALSKVNPACAMEVFGIIARRPHCVGDVPERCRSRAHTHPGDEVNR
jgi:hypothetical protein